jgi:hypothetical protein
MNSLREMDTMESSGYNGDVNSMNFNYIKKDKAFEIEEVYEEDENFDWLDST